MKPHLLPALLLLALPACTDPAAQGAPPARPSFTDPAFAQRVTGYRTVTLRPRQKTDGTTQDISASCTLTSADLTYPPLRAPVALDLPEVTGAPAPLIIRCDQGHLHAHLQLNPALDARGPLLPTPVGLVVAGVKYAAAQGQDRWVHYARRGDLEVLLEPTPAPAPTPGPTPAPAP